MSTDWIGNFFGFFEARISFVEKNCLEFIEGTILLTTYLDSLDTGREAQVLVNDL